MRMYMLLTAVTCIGLTFEQDDQSFALPSLDKSKWRDPNDFEPTSNCPPSSSTADCSSTDSDSLKAALDVCERELRSAGKTVDKSKSAGEICGDCAGDATLLKHVVHGILGRLRLQKRGKRKRDLKYSATLKLSPADVQIWHRLVDESHPDMNVVQDARHLLETFIVAVRREEDMEEDRSWWDVVMERGQVAVAVANVLLLFPAAAVVMQRIVGWRVTPSRFLFYFLSATFCISVVWTWLHLYKEKQAEIQMRLIKIGVPKECFPEEQESVFTTAAVYLKSLWSFAAPDKCLQYYKDVTIDPLFEVTPLEAIAMTLARFFLRPMTIVGEHLAKFVDAFYSRLPIAIAPLATILLILFVFAVFLFGFGYSFRFAYGLVSIEPSRTRHLLTEVETVARVGSTPSTPQIDGMQSVPHSMTSTARTSAVDERANRLSSMSTKTTGSSSQYDLVKRIRHRTQSLPRHHD